MPEPLRLDAAMDARTREVLTAGTADVGRLLDAWRAEGAEDAEMHLALAVASARFVSHAGPFLGHGTFNGGPVLRAAVLLPWPYRRLALLQTAAYVVSVMRHPNYGPFLMLAQHALDDPADTDEAASSRFLEAALSSDQPLAAEHRVVGLARRLGPAVRWPLMDLGLRQFAENEHRVLVVWRAAQLMDDAGGWRYGEPLMRAAVQYLANRVDTAHFDACTERRGSEAVRLGETEGVARLVEADWGQEPHILAALAAENGRGAALDAAARASAVLMQRAGWDAHAVTGVHCLLEVARDAAAPPALQAGALQFALSGQRTRRQKAADVRARWEAPIHPTGQRVDLEAVLKAVREDSSGQQAAQLAADYLVEAGGEKSAAEFASALMQAALETAGPFEAIHNVKMLGGLYQEYRRSPHPDRWIHLAAGAGAVARSVGDDEPGREAVLAQWEGTAAARR